VEPVRDEEITSLIAAVSSVEGVEKVIFISKDEAALIFKQEFGEDINQVLDFNPLPPSFKILLKEPYRNALSAKDVAARIGALKGMESVTYRKILLELIDERAAGINRVMLALGILVSLSAVFLVSNTIRLAIHAKRNLLRTMELVGATRGFIRLPFLLEGLMQGFLGGLSAAALLWFLFVYASRLASAEFSSYLNMPPFLYGGVIMTGMFLGFAGSMISVLRFVRPSATR
jgi:cell division transport system permease protein